jgi:2-iminoacetate synthase ThiH
VGTEEMVELIEATGKRAVQRDTAYRTVKRFEPAGAA